jgi:fructose-specific phosphotransferase system component IIB
MARRSGNCHRFKSVGKIVVIVAAQVGIQPSDAKSVKQVGLPQVADIIRNCRRIIKLPLKNKDRQQEEKYGERPAESW